MSRPPLPVPGADADAAALLGWSARLSDGAAQVRAVAVTVEAALACEPLTGPAGTAMQQLGTAVVGEVTALAAECAQAAGGCHDAAVEALAAVGR